MDEEALKAIEARADAAEDGPVMLAKDKVTMLVAELRRLRTIEAAAKRLIIHIKKQGAWFEAGQELASALSCEVPR